MVVAAFLLDILGHLPILCSHNAYPYPQSVLGMFSRMVDHFYGPQPWLAEDALILGTTPYAIMIKTDFSVC